MKKEQDYIQQIAEIRTMMERSSRFLSLSGWAGIMAGIYALSGVFIAWYFLDFNPNEIGVSNSGNLQTILLLALVVLLLALGTAIYFSWDKARRKGENIWNPTTKRLLLHMAVPLIAGGLLIIILMFRGLISLFAPLSLIFYGLALYNAGKFTTHEVKNLGLAQLGLGLLSAWLPLYGLIFWAAGFGLAHIVYGVYMHFKYER